MNISNEELLLLKSTISEVGFAGVENAISDDLFGALSDEAMHQYTNARRASNQGVISYRSKLADLGQAASNFLTGNRIEAFLRSIFDQSFHLITDSSCYTYYGQGDFLTAHKDGADDCEVTVLLYMDATSPDAKRADTGLLLEIYDDKGGNPGGVRHVIKTKRGLLVVGRGSEEWHGRPPLLEGERVAMLTACYASVA